MSIPLIALSLPLFGVALFVPGTRWLPVTMFFVGWGLQFVGLQWRFAKVRGRA